MWIGPLRSRRGRLETRTDFSHAERCLPQMFARLIVEEKLGPNIGPEVRQEMT